MSRPYEHQNGAAKPLSGQDPAAIRQRLETLERLLEGSFNLPGSARKIGFDALLGLIPVAGDTIAAAVGLYLVWEARNLKMSRLQQARMAGRVGFDWLLGLVPIAGDVFDIVYRSNSKNLKTILNHLDRHHPSTRIIDG